MIKMRLIGVQVKGKNTAAWVEDLSGLPLKIAKWHRRKLREPQ
jgi:hypothetical protein